jgi:hypothetical protein
MPAEAQSNAPASEAKVVLAVFIFSSFNEMSGMYCRNAAANVRVYPLAFANFPPYHGLDRTQNCLLLFIAVYAYGRSCSMSLDITLKI